MAGRAASRAASICPGRTSPTRTAGLHPARAGRSRLAAIGAEQAERVVCYCGGGISATEACSCCIAWATTTSRCTMPRWPNGRATRACRSSAADAMERSVRMQLGVVVERRELETRGSWAWKSGRGDPGRARARREWRELVRGERLDACHAANLPLELHRAETEAYRVNLAQRPPRACSWCCQGRRPERGRQRVPPLLVTASP